MRFSLGLVPAGLSHFLFLAIGFSLATSTTPTAKSTPTLIIKPQHALIPLPKYMKDKELTGEKELKVLRKTSSCLDPRFSLSLITLDQQVFMELDMVFLPLMSDILSESPRPRLVKADTKATPCPTKPKVDYGF